MKNQALFSSKSKSKKLKCLLRFLYGALGVKVTSDCIILGQYHPVIYCWKLDIIIEFPFPSSDIWFNIAESICSN